MGLKNKTIIFKFSEEIVEFILFLALMFYLVFFLCGGGESRTGVTRHGMQAYYQLSYLDCYSESIIFRKIVMRIRLQMSLFQPF